VHIFVLGVRCVGAITGDSEQFMSRVEFPSKKRVPCAKGGGRKNSGPRGERACSEIG